MACVACVSFVSDVVPLKECGVPVAATAVRVYVVPMNRPLTSHRDTDPSSTTGPPRMGENVPPRWAGLDGAMGSRSSASNILF